MRRSLIGLLAGACVLLATGVTQAQCTKDTDCKGDRVCEGGSCVDPSSLPAPAGTPAVAPAPAAPAPAAPTPPAAPAPAAPAPPAASAPAAPAPAAAPPVAAAPAPQPPAELPRRRRHSTGMMVGGIVMVSVAPIALIVAGVASAEQNACETSDYYFDGTGISTYGNRDCSGYDKTVYGGLIVGLALVGAGIPLIVIGGKKEPAEPTATVTPWATPTAAGLGLRLEM